MWKHSCPEAHHLSSFPRLMEHSFTETKMLRKEDVAQWFSANNLFGKIVRKWPGKIFISFIQKDRDFLKNNFPKLSVENMTVSFCTSKECRLRQLIPKTELQYQNEELCSPGVPAVQRTVLCRHNFMEFGFLMLPKMFLKPITFKQKFCDLSCNVIPAY